MCSFIPMQIPSKSVGNFRNPQVLPTGDVQLSFDTLYEHNGYIYIHIYIGYRFHNAHKTLPSHSMYNLKYKSND